jgi:cell division protein FtsW
MSQAVHHAALERRAFVPPQSDAWLFAAFVVIAGIGLVMVASASVSIAHRSHLPDLFYFWKQASSLLFGVVCAWLVTLIPLRLFERFSTVLLLVGALLLAAVLVPGVGHEVNGAMRWLRFGPVAFQASEAVKLAVIIYVAAYLVRHHEQVRSDFVGFIKPVGVVTVIAALLLLEPDYGAAVVLFSTALGMLFLGGVPLLRFFLWGIVAVSTLACLAVMVPYRMLRLMAFMDPWADPYDSGFQLTQALIAFGRGEWFGVGLGNGIQKLFYLPEAHTDFVFAVLGEELGLAGTLAIIVLFMFLIWRIFFIGGLAERKGMRFGAYIAYGIGLLIGLEAFINMGVNIGLLPTKGLTLPLMSYGSNSIIMICIALGFVQRVAKESSACADGPLRGRSLK